MKHSVSSRPWLTRNVVAIGCLSLFSDMGHELTTAVLPLFLATFGHGAAILGTVEGLSDAASSLLKMWTSHLSDQMGQRKPVIVIGYLCTAFMGCFAFATNWIQVLQIRLVGWMGRGARGPVRDALLSESVSDQDHGKAFGFQSAMDTVGAIIGPLIALSLIGIWPLRRIFLVSFIPGAITVYIAIFVLKDLPHKPQRSLRLLASIRTLPSNYWVYLAAVGVFGLGNFAHTLLILRAVKALTPRYGEVIAGRAGIAFYAFHNFLYAAVSYPAGVLGDRMDKRKLLAAGYALFGVMCLGFLVVDDSIAGLAILFALAGIYIGIVDGTERALAASFLNVERRNIGFGMLATVNSFGDLLSSVIVGFLWNRFSFAWGFWYSGVLTLAGAAALLLIPRTHEGKHV